LASSIGLVSCAGAPSLDPDRPAGFIAVSDDPTGRPIASALLRLVAQDPTHPLRIRDALRTPRAEVLIVPANADGVIALPAGMADPGGRVTAQVLAPGFLAAQLDLGALGPILGPAGLRSEPVRVQLRPILRPD
jgi:hypothetical protein